MSTEIIKPTDQFEYYQDHVFYTNFDLFSKRENKKISGDESVGWIGHVQQNYAKSDTAFVFSCGNGWVEREFFNRNIIKKVVGFDIMSKYVEEARREADKIGLPNDYYIADGNTIEFDKRDYDIILNSGAMHHIARINRFTKLISELCSDGVYIAHDYTGAHRNQYSLELWERVLRAQASMPEAYRVDLRYPHMPTMLAADPSEAIHSELQMDVVARHFDLAEHARLGGGVAHALLQNNRALHADQHTPQGRAVLEMIARADEAALDEVPDGNLFTFFVARPKRAKPAMEQLRAWQQEEDEREARAAENQGRYYDQSVLEMIYNDLAWKLYWKNIEAEADVCAVRREGEARIALAESQVAAMRRSTSWRATRPLRGIGALLRGRSG